MREFAQVMPTFWTGETGRAIKGKPELQVLAFYLFTNPHSNALGLYYLPIPFIVHETGLPEKKIIDGFKKLADFAKYDAASEFVWVIGMAGRQLGEMDPTDNRMKGIRKLWAALPANPFTGDFWAKYGEKYGFERRASKGLAKGLARASDNPGRALEESRSPQIIETETETETETELAPTSGAAITPAIIPEVIKPLTPIQLVVRGWKIQSGNDPEDTAWDKAHFAANAAHAKRLLELFNGDVDACLDCIEDRWNALVVKQGLSLSLAGVVKASDVFRQKWLEGKERRETGVR